MKSEETPDGRLIVTYYGTGVSTALLLLTTVLTGTALYDVFLGSRGTERLVGLLAAAATCGLSAAASLETTSFGFTRATQIVTWHRRWGVRQRSGSIPFGSIQSVVAERAIGDGSPASRRITLRTTDGQIIPLTIGYRPDTDGSILAVARQIREVLGHDERETCQRHVRVLIAEGKSIEAIRVLREAEGLSLVEAKRRVDALSHQDS